MASFSVDTLKNNLTNPQRTYLFEILIPSPIGGGDGNVIAIRAESTEIPGKSFGRIAIPYKQTAGIEVAGKLTYDHTWSVVLREGEDHASYDVLNDWANYIVNPLTGIGVGDPLYKTDLYVIEQTTVGGTSLKFKIKGAWIQNIAKVALSYADEGIVKLDCTFVFDDFEPIE